MVDNVAISASSIGQLDTSKFECSICYDLLLDPVVGECRPSGKAPYVFCLRGLSRALPRC
jgi:hypothetical protein